MSCRMWRQQAYQRQRVFNHSPSPVCNGYTYVCTFILLLVLNEHNQKDNTQKHDPQKSELMKLDQGEHNKGNKHKNNSRFRCCHFSVIESNVRGDPLIILMF